MYFSHLEWVLWWAALSIPYQFAALLSIPYPITIKVKWTNSFMNFHFTGQSSSNPFFWIFLRIFISSDFVIVMGDTPLSEEVNDWDGGLTWKCPESNYLLFLFTIIFRKPWLIDIDMILQGPCLTLPISDPAKPPFLSFYFRRICFSDIQFT